MLLLQEHWLTPANLSKFDSCFTDFFFRMFGDVPYCRRGYDSSSSTSSTLRGRPFGGVITLIGCVNSRKQFIARNAFALFA